MNQYRLYYRDSGTWSKKLYTMFQMLQSKLPADTIICRSGSEQVQTLAELLHQGNTPLLVPATATCGNKAQTDAAPAAAAKAPQATPTAAGGALASAKRDALRLLRLTCTLFIGTWVIAVSSATAAATSLLIGSQCAPDIPWSVWLIVGALAGLPIGALCLHRILAQ